MSRKYKLCTSKAGLIFGPHILLPRQAGGDRQEFQRESERAKYMQTEQSMVHEELPIYGHITYGMRFYLKLVNIDISSLGKIDWCMRPELHLRTPNDAPNIFYYFNRFRGVIWGGWGAVAPRKKKKRKKKREKKKEGNYE